MKNVRNGFIILAMGLFRVDNIIAVGLFNEGDGKETGITTKQGSEVLTDYTFAEIVSELAILNEGALEIGLPFIADGWLIMPKLEFAIRLDRVGHVAMEADEKEGYGAIEFGVIGDADYLLGHIESTDMDKGLGELVDFYRRVERLISQ